ncbi:hypothetical protein BDV27DRAFT_152686 [Aspergillus caelatus]|uniref:Hydrophobic surface binding protein A-domain-containing protein n=2 Tax=Aspergillus subgen. Circumdati TaxID=2720871 RepID=A0A5N7AIU3_9EURO|nr:uncharacterized protein BDV27DRAFT_152686 [Aspergillus caelatus]KAE8369804.1 hypothetical protein BDV27DRAFT_152686 [Aspergillus caelatus]KAE8416250.1 hypothetical protein BDV36DRAFT_297223 [Aspergillus pseudocaelatus]
MKVQTLCSLAAVGLTFATPIHNRQVSTQLECIGNAAKGELAAVIEKTQEKAPQVSDMLNQYSADIIAMVENAENNVPTPSDWQELLGKMGPELTEFAQTTTKEQLDLLKSATSTFVAQAKSCLGPA